MTSPNHYPWRPQPSPAELRHLEKTATANHKEISKFKKKVNHSLKMAGDDVALNRIMLDQTKAAIENSFKSAEMQLDGMVKSIQDRFENQRRLRSLTNLVKSAKIAENSARRAESHRAASLEKRGQGSRNASVSSVETRRVNSPLVRSTSPDVVDLPPIKRSKYIPEIECITNRSPQDNKTSPEIMPYRRPEPKLQPPPITTKLPSKSATSHTANSSPLVASSPRHRITRSPDIEVLPKPSSRSPRREPRQNTMSEKPPPTRTRSPELTILGPSKRSKSPPRLNRRPSPPSHRQNGDAAIPSRRRSLGRDRPPQRSKSPPAPRRSYGRDRSGGSRVILRRTPPRQSPPRKSPRRSPPGRSPPRASSPSRHSPKPYSLPNSARRSPPRRRSYGRDRGPVKLERSPRKSPEPRAGNESSSRRSPGRERSPVVRIRPESSATSWRPTDDPDWWRYKEKKVWKESETQCFRFLMSAQLSRDIRQRETIDQIAGDKVKFSQIKVGNEAMLTIEGFRPGQIIAALQRIMTDVELRNRRAKNPCPKIAYNIDPTAKRCLEVEAVEIALIMNKSCCDFLEHRITEKDSTVPEVDQVTFVRSKQPLPGTREFVVCLVGLKKFMVKLLQWLFKRAFERIPEFNFETTELKFILFEGSKPSGLCKNIDDQYKRSADKIVNDEPIELNSESDSDDDSDYVIRDKPVRKREVS